MCIDCHELCTVQRLLTNCIRQSLKVLFRRPSSDIIAPICMTNCDSIDAHFLAEFLINVVSCPNVDPFPELVILIK